MTDKETTAFERTCDLDFPGKEGMPHCAGPHVEAARSIRRQKSKGKAQATAFIGVSIGKVMHAGLAD